MWTPSSPNSTRRGRTVGEPKVPEWHENSKPRCPHCGHFALTEAEECILAALYTARTRPDREAMLEWIEAEAHSDDPDAMPCEHCQKAAPAGKRFCSDACLHCEHES